MKQFQDENKDQKQVGGRKRGHYSRVLDKKIARKTLDDLSLKTVSAVTHTFTCKQ